MNIIAEIGTSHEGNLNKALELIDAAKEAGADTVKFQWVYADEILHPNTGFVNLPTGKISLYERFKSLELNTDFYKECLDYCHKINIKFACSPFGLKSFNELIKINPDFIKIASPELNHTKLLKECSKYLNKIPIIISSGVSKLADIEKALELLNPDDIEIKPNYLTLLHCSTFYPTPEEEYNVKLVKNLSKIFGISCGVSDHSLDPVLVPVLTCAMNGKMIEKHITLSNQTKGLDDPIALEPEKFALMVHSVHQTEALINRLKNDIFAQENGKYNFSEDELPESILNEIITQLEKEYPKEKILRCLGDGIKKLSKSEKENYGKTNRSLHYTKDLKEGSIISLEDIKILRTEKILTPGIHPSFLDKLINAKLSRNVNSGDGVMLEDFIFQ